MPASSARDRRVERQLQRRNRERKKQPVRSSAGPKTTEAGTLIASPSRCDPSRIPCSVRPVSTKATCEPLTVGVLGSLSHASCGRRFGTGTRTWTEISTHTSATSPLMGATCQLSSTLPTRKADPSLETCGLKHGKTKRCAKGSLHVVGSGHPVSAVTCSAARSPRSVRRIRRTKARSGWPMWLRSYNPTG